MERRDPLAKQKFLEGNRQRWCALLILCAGGILWADMTTDIDPAPYLTFLTVVGPAFIIGLSMDSYRKIGRAKHHEHEPEDR